MGYHGGAVSVDDARVIFSHVAFLSAKEINHATGSMA